MLCCPGQALHAVRPDCSFQTRKSSPLIREEGRNFNAKRSAGQDPWSRVDGAEGDRVCVQSPFSKFFADTDPGMVEGVLILSWKYWIVHFFFFGN